MPEKNGFSLIEFIVVLVILSILIAIALPVYIDNTQRGAAIAAQNNLTAIYNAQKAYYLSNNAYCTSAGAICNSTASINTNLTLNIIDSNFGYTCTNAGGFKCTATNNGAATFVLTLTNASIVLPGGAGALNPSCAYPAHPGYCPN